MQFSPLIWDCSRARSTGRSNGTQARRTHSANTQGSPLLAQGLSLSHLDRRLEDKDQARPTNQARRRRRKRRRWASDHGFLFPPTLQIQTGSSYHSRSGHFCPCYFAPTLRFVTDLELSFPIPLESVCLVTLEVQGSQTEYFLRS